MYNKGIKLKPLASYYSRLQCEAQVSIYTTKGFSYKHWLPISRLQCEAQVSIYTTKGFSYKHRLPISRLQCEALSLYTKGIWL